MRAHPEQEARFGEQRGTIRIGRDGADLQGDDPFELVIECFDDLPLAAVAYDLEQFVAVLQQFTHRFPFAGATLCRGSFRTLGAVDAELEVWTVDGRSRVALTGERGTIGKDAENDIAFDDGTVSRLPAICRPFPAGWGLRSLR